MCFLLDCHVAPRRTLWASPLQRVCGEATQQPVPASETGQTAAVKQEACQLGVLSKRKVTVPPRYGLAGLATPYENISAWAITIQAGRHYVKQLQKHT
jgi:hypothetical protein